MTTKYFALISLLLGVCVAVGAGNSNRRNQVRAVSGQLPSEQYQVAQFSQRLKNKRLRNILDGAFWTFAHDYAEYKHMDETMKTIGDFLEAIAKYENGDRAPLEQLGGIKAFKEKLAYWLNDDDQAIRAFAATLMGVIGDKAYAPQLANLLKDKKYAAEHLGYERGRAAMSLGLVGAKEYAPSLVSLLVSSNPYDRSGAAYGLGFLGEKGQARAVAKLLHDRNEAVREAARESLKMMENNRRRFRRNQRRLAA